MTPYLGQISAFGFNFAPIGWAMCNGQKLSIAQNQALFTLLGTYYGGDGIQTFGLPDLRGRTPLHQGQGPGLSNYAIGQMGGSEAVTLMSTQMPSHMHLVTVSSSAGSKDTPGSSYLAAAGLSTDGTPVTMYGTSPNTTMAQMGLTVTGGSQPHNNMQPYLAINWCIATQGIYPTQN